MTWLAMTVNKVCLKLLQGKSHSIRHPQHIFAVVDLLNFIVLPLNLLGKSKDLAYHVLY